MICESMYRRLKKINVFRCRRTHLVLTILFSLISLGPVLGADISVKMIDTTTGEALTDYFIDVRKSDLDQDKVENTISSTPGNGTIVGRQQIIFTKALEHGPFMGAAYIRNTFGEVKLHHFFPGKYVIAGHKPGYSISELSFNHD